jgi:hypothetical protein
MMLRAARTRALVAALFTALMLVPVASASAATPAERFPADGAEMARAMQIATDFWKAQPCGGQVALRWDSLAAGTRAEAVWQNFEHAWTNPGGNFDCAIVFNRAMPFEWPDLCTTVIHEVGHLLGHQHSDHHEHEVMAEHAIEPLPVCGGAAKPAAATTASVRSTTTRRTAVRRCVRRMKSRGAKAYAARRTCARRAAARSPLR